MSPIHMATEFWQEETIVEALKRFNAYERIKALAVFGSYGASLHLCDEWSDLDLFLVIEDEALPEFASGVQWVEEFEELYAYEQSANSFSSTTRCCFRDGRKIDFVAATLGGVQNPENWAHLTALIGARILFERAECDALGICIIHLN